MNDRPPQLNPIAAAAEWVSRIVSVGLLMVLPGLGGDWLDKKFGTNFLVLIGFAFGLTAGLYHLLRVTGAIGKPTKQDAVTTDATKQDITDEPPSKQDPLR